MEQYLNLLNKVLNEGTRKSNRTDTDTIALFGTQTRYDLSNNTFPAVTTKKLFFDSVVKELLWFIRGETNISTLGCKIWDEWADEQGNLGPIYGEQWCSWPKADGTSINQLEQVIEQIKSTPGSRRMIVSAWNVGQLEDMRLPPCHLLFQFFVNDNKLSCQLYQRSADLFLGVPFNIASYSLLTHMIAHICGLKPGEFIHTTGDTHIYVNHIEQVKQQLTRKPHTPPTVNIPAHIKSLDCLRNLEPASIQLVNYQHEAPLRAKVAV